MTNVRNYTNKLLEMIEQGCVTWEEVARECLSEMSEADVEAMCNTTGWVDDSEFEEEEND